MITADPFEAVLRPKYAPLSSDTAPNLIAAARCLTKSNATRTSWGQTDHV
jgi:hypothetical protein